MAAAAAQLAPQVLGRNKAAADYFRANTTAPVVLPDGFAANGSPLYYAASADWPNMAGVDASNFFCSQYAIICGVILDEVSCPDSNRLVDPAASYSSVCLLALTRLGCPSANITIAASADPGAVPTWACTCGSYTTGSVRALELVADKLADLTMQQRPIFSDPVYLSTQLSLAMVMVVGKLGSVLANAIYLPPVLGFLFAGLGIQDIVQLSLIKGASILGSKAFTEMRVFCLIIVLMKAGLSIKPSEAVKKGAMTLMLATLPYICELAVMIGMGVWLLKPDPSWGAWTGLDIGLMCSILSALSPALVIPGMVKMVEEVPTVGFVPQTVLNSAPIEVFFADIIFSIFATLEDPEPNPFFPWVRKFELWANLVLIPVNIALTCLVGGVVGWAMSKYFIFRSVRRPWMDRIVAASTAELLFVFVVGSYTMYALATQQYIQQTSAVLIVFAVGLAVSEFTPYDIVHDLKEGINGIWTFVEVILFTTAGINLSLRAVNGPEQSMRGMTSANIGVILAMLCVAMLGRAVGVFLSGACTWFQQPPHRRTTPYFATWWLATWICQMPKATLQATLGGLPYAFHIIPGADGLQRGLIIQQASVIAIIWWATLGIFATQRLGRPLALRLAAADRAAEPTTPPTPAEKAAADAAAPADGAIAVAAGEPRPLPDRPTVPSAAASTPVLAPLANNAATAPALALTPAPGLPPGIDGPALRTAASHKKVAHGAVNVAR